MRSLLFFLFFTTFLQAASLDEDLQQHVKWNSEGENRVGKILIDDKSSGISQATWAYVKNALDHYKANKPILIILELNTPGGEVYSAQKISDALKEMADIVAAGRIPLLVGGTMLYFKTLLEGLSPLPPADSAVRERIEQDAERLGWGALHQQLLQIDPVAGARIHPNDPQRLSRALEVFYISGKTLTELTQVAGDALPYLVHQFAIAPSSRELLHQRIEDRFHQMVAAGFEDEVKSLMARGDLHPDLPAIRCVGYRQMWSYLNGDIGHDEMVYRGVCATRQLSKRQMTWFKKNKEIQWFGSGDIKNLEKFLKTRL